MHVFKIPLKLTWALLSAAAVMFCSCSGQDQLVHSEVYYDMFDTFVTVSAYGVDKESFDTACTVIKEELYQRSCLYDIYREYDGINNLATVNKNAGISPVRVDRRLIELVEFSIDAYTLTDGKVNIAMGSVLSLWHDARENSAVTENNTPPPTEQELREAYKHTNINDIIIDTENMTLYLSDPEMSLDVGAVAKGFSADAAREKLGELGIEDSYYVNLGGNVITVGYKYPNDKTPWQASVNTSYLEYDTPPVRLSLIDESLVTSAVNERFFTYGSESYHHIIDPETLMPAAYFDSVSIKGRSSAMCDVLSTALFCMSESDGSALIESLEGVEALWINERGTHSTSGFFPNAD